MNYSEVSHIAFDASLPMLLNDALDGVMPAYRSIFSAHDLTEQQWRVLRVLWDETEMANIHISRRTLIPPIASLACWSGLKSVGSSRARGRLMTAG